VIAYNTENQCGLVLRYPLRNSPGVIYPQVGNHCSKVNEISYSSGIELWAAAQT